MGTRSFIRENLPDTELKSKIRIMLNISKSSPHRCPLVISALDQCSDYDDVIRRLTKNLLDISVSGFAPNKVKHSLLSNSVGGLSNQEAAHRAWSLLFEDAMEEVDQLFSDGKLDNLQGSSRTIEGVNRSIHVTTGRMSKTALEAVSGHQELPIISSSSRLAELIVQSSHKSGGHKMFAATLARTRHVAYILSPGNLIKRVLQNCTLCKIKKGKAVEQLMGKHPIDRVCPTPPFQKVSVDMVGHFWVKPTKASDRSIKTWVLMYLCDVSKALHTEIVESCSAESMINSLRSCFSIRNTPFQITADPGRNFVGAKSKIQAREQQMSREPQEEVKGYWPSVNWIILPPEAPWKNGSVEALIKQLKSSLKMLPSQNLTLLEFKTVIDEITCAINNRPLSLMSDSLQPLTPNLLILGRNFSLHSPLDPKFGDTNATALCQYLKSVYQTWWGRWKVEVLPQLFAPGSKWSNVHPNIQVDDICLLLSSKGKSGHSTTYKYCRVVKTVASGDGLVRKAYVKYHIPSLKQKEMLVDVRRLIILPLASPVT